MAEPLDPKKVVSIEELTISNMYEIEALIEVLARHGMKNTGFGRCRKHSL